ncbi:MAG: FYDLN acid domain-containing protein [Rhodospirillaceae bacterium]|nr:FYDLN acid domain-containing protein [Rhodospirillaceae bacterium]
MGKVDLGEKLTCSSCEARFYDLSKTPAICPKCGAENQRPKVTKAKKVETAPKPEKEASKVAAADDDTDNLEDDDEDDLIDDDDDLDDDDDDVDSVIGPIDSENDTDT